MATLLKWLKRLGYFLLFVYVFICGVLYFYQETLIFHPTVLPAGQTFWAGEEVYLPMADGVELHGLWIKERNSKGVILYLHGNKGSNHRCLRQAENLMGLGYDVFMIDYRGFGKSGGEPENESQLFGDAQQVYDWLRTHYREEEMVVVGYSLGSGMAAYLAEQNAPKQLCLVAPYRSMLAMKNIFIPVIPSFLVKYPLRTDSRLPKTDTPTLICHGTQDDLIPFEHSVYLESIDSEDTQLVPLEGVSHRGAIFSKVLRRELAARL